MKGTKRILVVDDEMGMCESLKLFFSKEGYRVDTAQSGAEALELLEKDTYHLLILDVRMRGMDGIDVLRKAKELKGEIPAIMISAYASPESAVNAMLEGAYDYLPKPFKISELKRVVKEALGEEGKVEELPIGPSVHFNLFVGESPGMKRVYTLIEKASQITCNVLILGESGTGKELVARAIHENSHRKDKPFVVVNCAGLPETLIESELFGYKKGAFTGALQDKKGYFEVADGGTVFLDEIGELTPGIQVKLLRFLQERTFVSIGCTEEKKVDVRVIAATNRAIEKEVLKGRFREDLYFRLNVLKINLPPLRE
ncbi:MAG: sigma-54-dependent transcriptional regulator, partial [Desulfatiglandales bacterium]